MAAEHLLSSTVSLPLLVEQALLGQNCSLDKQSILDIGAGGGRLKRVTGDRFKIFALERDKNLCELMTKDLKEMAVVLADALSLPFRAGVFDKVVAINSVHEACAALSEQERADKLAQLVRNVHSVLRPGGEFLVYDGVMPEEDQDVHLKPKSDWANQTVETFLDTYKGKEVSAVRLADERFELSVADLTCFLTKFPYVHTDFWETEREQFYPFLTLTQVKSVLAREQLRIEEVLYPQSRIGLARFLQHYEVEEYTANTFPQVQTLIKAYK